MLVAQYVWHIPQTVNVYMLIGQIMVIVEHLNNSYIPMKQYKESTERMIEITKLYTL